MTTCCCHCNPQKIYLASFDLVTTRFTKETRPSKRSGRSITKIVQGESTTEHMLVTVMADDKHDAIYSIEKRYEFDGMGPNLNKVHVENIKVHDSVGY